MIYCFDTSALNKLHDDSEMKSLRDGIIATNTVWITALNVIEAGITKDIGRRLSLLQLQKKLSRHRRPLQIPDRLISELAIAYANRSPRGGLSIAEDQDNIWVALNDPEEIDEAARQELYHWKNDLENDFRESHTKARQDFQQLFEIGIATRPQSASSLLRHYLKSEDFLFEAMSDIYKRVTGIKLQREELFPFLRKIPNWTFFYLGWAYSIYMRSIQESNFGRKNAGNIDLWCATYLPICDVFVTDDIKQFKALRLINVFNQRKTEVLLYSRWRQRLLIS